LIDRRLYLPESWLAAEQAPARSRCGLGDEVPFQTKPDLALMLLHETLERGHLPLQWVAADARVGDTAVLLDGVAELGKCYFVEVACSTQVWWRQEQLAVPPCSGRGRRPTKVRLRHPYQCRCGLDVIVRRIGARCWQR
jgi:SRSO17 transposase